MTFIITCIVAVTCMTLFSALWSTVTNNQFREPILLSQILKKKFENISNHSAIITAWILHFLIGAIFLGLYEFLWWFTNVDRSIAWSLVLGSISGILGIIGWMPLFKAVNFSKAFHYRHYYIHLFFAHLVFSLTAFLVNQWLI